MSYDIYILKAPYEKAPDSLTWDEAEEHFQKQIVRFDEPHMLRGGTYIIGGTAEAWLNITYNYSSFYEEFLGGKGINDLDGKSVRETIPKMMEAACKMQGKTDADYWAKTEGNARKALLDLITLGLKALDGYWHVC